MDVIENDYEFLFLTLTCEAVKGKDLNNQISELYRAYGKLYGRKEFKKAVHGWVRCFEVNYNWETQTYNPHFHCILAVDKKNYFNSKNYLEQDDWCLLWKSCLDVKYKPIVWVEKFKSSEKGKGKEVAEVAKYTTKSSNIMANLKEIKDYPNDIKDFVKSYVDSISDEIVQTIDTALHSRQLMGYGGIFYQVKSTLKNSKNDDDYIITSADGEEVIHMPFEIESYRWDIGHRNYVKVVYAGSNDEDDENDDDEVEDDD